MTNNIQINLDRRNYLMLLLIELNSDVKCWRVELSWSWNQPAPEWKVWYGNLKNHPLVKKVFSKIFNSKNNVIKSIWCSITCIFIILYLKFIIYLFLWLQFFCRLLWFVDKNKVRRRILILFLLIYRVNYMEIKQLQVSKQPFLNQMLR